ncbi:hypothetical protein GCM10023238_39830 [Streptomyces heliomycini]
MERVPGQQQPSALAPELLLRHPADRQDQGARHAQPARAAQLDGQPDPGADGREGGEQGVQEIRPEVLPHGVQAAPGVPVARREGLQRVGGDVDAAVEDRAPAVAQGMRDHVRGVAPAQPVTLQVQPGDDREAAASG